MPKNNTRNKLKVKADSMQEQRHDSSEATGLVAINNSDSEASSSVKSVGQSNDGDFGNTGMPASEWTEVGTEFITDGSQKVLKFGPHKGQTYATVASNNAYVYQVMKNKKPAK